MKMYDFPKTSLQEWLKKVVHDLKGREISDLDWEIDKNISVSPFLDHSSIKAIENYLLISNPNSSWTFGIQEEYRGKATNYHLLNQLKFGASSLFLNIKNDISADELTELFENIQLEHIETHIHADHVGTYRFLVDFLNNYPQSNLQGSLNFLDKDHLPPSFIKKHPKFALYSGLSHSNHEPTSELLEILLHFKKSIDSGFNPKTPFVLRLNMTEKFITNIAKIRALRLLVHNLYTAMSWSIPEYKIIGVIEKPKEISDPNNYMIHWSSCILSAVIGTIDSIRINVDQRNLSNTQLRTAININHIYQYENQLTKVKDPLSGSYLVEKLTNELASKTWTKFASL